jgi:4-amino-4-deoxy-L-arabinose transferase-like glycosyltransferase
MGSAPSGCRATGPVAGKSAPFPAAGPVALQPEGRRRRAWLPWAIGALITVAGVLVRVIHWAGFSGRGFDEVLYAHYLRQLVAVGLGRYPDIVDSYLAYQKTIPGSILPPTRFLYIFCAYLWHGIFGGEPLAAFHAVSRLFSVLTLLLAGLAARRWVRGGWAALGVFALMAFSPLQIHLAQHALVDGFFEFWALLALWALWENLQQPRHRGWLAAYTVGLALMVATKENAFFVFVALVALLALARWLGLGEATRALWVLTLVGPLIGVAILANAAGGLPTLCEVYLVGVPKNLHLQYAILTGDGPWYRYLLDLLTVSPLVLILALGMLFQVRRDDKALIFLLVFIAVSYALMANVKYGLNLRYATIWDLPIRVLAASQCVLLAARCGRWQLPVFGALIAGLCAFDLAQYQRLAVAFPLYELVPLDLLHALRILK